VNVKQRSGSPQVAGDFRAIADRLLRYTSRGLSRIDYLRTVSEILLEFSTADAVEIWLLEGDKAVHCRAGGDAAKGFVFESLSPPAGQKHEAPDAAALGTVERFCRFPIRNLHDPALDRLNPAATSRPPSRKARARTPASRESVPGRSGSREDVGSRALLPIEVAGERIGLLGLESKKPGLITPQSMASLERLGQILGSALVSQRAHAALDERVKELTCLYGIAQIADQLEVPLDRVASGIVSLLPPAWQYPEIARARIVLDGRNYTTPDFGEGKHRQTAEITVNRRPRGAVEVVYIEERAALDEGPFLKEERSLIDAVAKHLALIIERHEAADERAGLQDQLRHADRLATIGQLAAGVAHELNEPLGNILGFAQLAKKAMPDLEQASMDLAKIVAASLHAREVVRKLMLFARQTPPRKTAVNPNQVVEQGLYFLEARCVKQGIVLQRRLDPALPSITADSSQLEQVLVNLVVNAIQAMPKGGVLVIETRATATSVVIAVEDTGVGMSEEVKSKVFLPFFTTKDVDQGTGLGLAVVHGIVSGHGGSIRVQSAPGRGSRFEIELPVDDRLTQEGTRHGSAS
jgi:two-component system NtrC family sensor kinase